MEQKEYDRIVGYHKTKTLPAALTKNQRDSFRRKCKHFVLKEGLLYYRDVKKEVDLQVSSEIPY